MLNFFKNNPKMIAALILGLIALYYVLPVIGVIFKVVVIAIVVAAAIVVYKVKRKFDKKT